jgi:hypothetical protein
LCSTLKMGPSLRPFRISSGGSNNVQLNAWAW